MVSPERLPAPRPVRAGEVVLPLRVQFYSGHPQFGQHFGQDLSQPARPGSLPARTWSHRVAQVFRLGPVLALGDVFSGGLVNNRCQSVDGVLKELYVFTLV